MPFLSMCRRGCHRTGNVQLGRLEAVSTQGLASSELFRLVQSGSDKLVVEPILQSLEVAVRAIVIPVVDPEVAFMLYRHAREVLEPIISSKGTDVYWQNPMEYHASLYHASHHKDPQEASAAEIDEEGLAIRSAAEKMCSLTVMLDRVICTSSGTLLALWQVIGGTDPAQMRMRLHDALPRSPPSQLISDREILHTTIARLLHVPELGLVQALQKLNARLCGVATKMEELWWILEHELMALGLGGRVTRTRIALPHCPVANAS
mmetsp:Transcript_4195/g.15072  ORF Transcript_4195/g.15072 Transcript_4195/m.15072 type:complete len:263 (+) Transcript_4195:558-1346(+)